MDTPPPPNPWPAVNLGLSGGRAHRSRRSCAVPSSRPGAAVTRRPQSDSRVPCAASPRRIKDPHCLLKPTGMHCLIAPALKVQLPFHNGGIESVKQISSIYCNLNGREAKNASEKRFCVCVVLAAPRLNLFTVETDLYDLLLLLLLLLLMLQQQWGFFVPFFFQGTV